MLMSSVVINTGMVDIFFFFFFQAEDGIRDLIENGVQTCALPIYTAELQSQAEEGIRDLIVTGVQTCRSEERSVWKECRSRWWPNHHQKIEITTVDRVFWQGSEN